MSEYQYYEFVAVDQPLTREEMAELRSRSSRAAITATSFVNEYNWGDLKADPGDWMRRYFDALVYTANWCSCRLALRLPHGSFTKNALKRYATSDSLTIDDSQAHWIINWSLDEGQDYDRFGMETGQGWMGRLVPLRDELLRGDLRPLYLGWLAGVSASGEANEEATEPEVPPGMAQLSAAQQALAEFLEIDPDLLTAAAAGSQELKSYWHDDDSIEVWVAGLSRDEIGVVFNLLLQGASQQAERWVKSEFVGWLKESGLRESLLAKPRRVAELRALAKESKKRRLKHEEKKRAQYEADCRKQREAYLRTLAAEFDRHWKIADEHAERGTSSGYGEATRVIVDLADAYALASDRKVFDEALRHFMVRHARRSALVRRLVETGLWQK